MNKNLTIYVAGHKGMVGSAVMRLLQKNGYKNLVYFNSGELDLRVQSQVNELFSQTKIDVVIDAAARVGGILANHNFPYNFLMENLQIQNNLIDASLKYEVNKFIFLGSSCIYPKFAPQPIKEEYLLTDSLEPTNQWYAIAKIAGVKACEAVRIQFGKNFISLMPTNLYGPNDNFDLETSHVLPALIRKFHEAKQNNHAPVVLWGTGNPFREFLHVDDLAKAILFAVENDLPDALYNVGTGVDLSIRELAELVQSIVCHRGDIIWDHSKPDGTPRKLLNVEKINNLGWKAEIDLATGIKNTYEWFLQNESNLKSIKL